jgi:hypothetical protein
MHKEKLDELFESLHRASSIAANYEKCKRYGIK